MDFLKKPAPPSSASLPPPKVAPVPAQLPKITAPTAAQLCQASQPSPPALQLLTPQQTPAQYLSALQEKQMGEDMVKTLAHGLPDREGVAWAAQSAQKVSDKLPPADVQALKAAQTWVKNPTEINKSAAAAAAAKTDFQGPGAWAAQAAAWSQPTPPPAVPRLTPHAVSGAVLLSSAIAAHPELAAPKAPQAPKAPPLSAPSLAVPSLAPPTPKLAAAKPPPAVVPPAVQAQTFKEQHPFIAMGLAIASGKGSGN